MIAIQADTKDEVSHTKTNEAFKEAFFWPEDVSKCPPKRQREKIPSVITSEMWQEYTKQKVDKKKEFENQKEVRRLQREEKKLNLSTKTKINTAKKTKDSVKENVPTSPEIELGKHVIFTYENEYFPGVILEIKKTQLLIKSMTMGSTESWKWPLKDDVLWYNREDILEVIAEPVSVNKRGSYTVPEIDKYRKAKLTIY